LRRKLSPELADEVMTQIEEIQNAWHNIIFLFIDNERAITGIHVPDEALGEEEGPVLMRGAHPNHIIAAFSQSEIRKKIKGCDGIEIITGLDDDRNDSSSDLWVHELELMSEAVMMKLKENPPEQWEDLLKS